MWIFPSIITFWLLSGLICWNIISHAKMLESFDILVKEATLPKQVTQIQIKVFQKRKHGCGPVVKEVSWYLANGPISFYEVWRKW